MSSLQHIRDEHHAAGRVPGSVALVERRVLGLDDQVDHLLPELTGPVVLRQANGPLDDIAPAERSTTVRDLLTLRGGTIHSRRRVTVARVLQERLHQGRPRPQLVPPTQEWMARLGEIPLVHQPGAGWTSQLVRRPEPGHSQVPPKRARALLAKAEST
jgi:CubicO group peptidase (beta-lactamase class C family)